MFGSSNLLLRVIDERIQLRKVDGWKFIVDSRICVLIVRQSSHFATIPISSFEHLYRQLLTKRVDPFAAAEKR